jgi:hypothetical protein
MAEGGIASQLFGPRPPEMMGASLKETQIKITGGDELINKIKDAIEKSQPQPIKVDTEGVSVPVNTEGASVPISTESANNIADKISSSIEAALSNVGSDTGTRAVGAESMDELKDLVTNVQDKIFVVKDDLAEFKNKTEARFTTVVTQQTLNSAVQNTVSNAIDRVQRDIDKNRNDISQNGSDIRRIDAKYEQRYESVRRIADHGVDLARGK